MLNKSNLDIASITPLKDGFSAILITQDCTVANDGRRLIEVTRPKAFRENEFLNVDNFNASYIDIAGEIRTCHRDFMLSRSDALEISKKIKPKALNPILRNAVISHNGTTQIATADPKSLNTSVQNVKPVEGKYPKYQEVIPSSENTTFKIGLSPKFLAEICALADKFQDDDYKMMTFEFSNPESAVKMTTVNNETKQKFTAVLMPMDLKETK